MLELEAVSSLNLRMGRTQEKKLLKPIPFFCTLCGRRRLLGKNEAVMVKALVDVNGKVLTWMLCGSCMDAVADAMRYGPTRVGHKKILSRVARVAVVHEELMCLKCMSKSSSHMFVKYDDLRFEGDVKYGSVRVCAKCAVAYVQISGKNGREVLCVE